MQAAKEPQRPEAIIEKGIRTAPTRNQEAKNEDLYMWGGRFGRFLLIRRPGYFLDGRDAGGQKL
jgi:hypothetical protein